MRALKLVAALAIGLASSCAYADIYGYIDGNGTAHFSTEKVDERYQLFMRGNTSFDTAQRALAESKQTPLTEYLSRHPGLKKIEPILQEAAQEFALDPALLKAVMAAESGFNANAVSPKGAVGLMQIMPATAERYGLQGDRKRTLEQKLADPKINIRVGARYLRDLHRMFPSQPELVLASYNAGEGAVQKYKNTIPPYAETRSYVQIVKQFYQLYKPAAQALSIAKLSDTAGGARRVHMTIPGRRNMPSTIPE
ncbi:MAG: lytic transglycosylase domain-containing protein [Noviherbaspirillum sp.]